MHSEMSRLSNLLAFSMTVMACVTGVCFLSTFNQGYSTSVELSVSNLRVRNARDHTLMHHAEYAYRQRNEDSSAELSEDMTEVEQEAYLTRDLGFMTFDLYANMAPLFNWNVKQLFLYLVAEYDTANHAVNQVVLWDKILLSGENAVLDYRSMNTKYYFWDDGQGLLGNKNVTLRLQWCVIPNVGSLVRDQSSNSVTLSFPSKYAQHTRQS